MKVAITGANGYIGRSLSKFLLDAGHHVVALVRQPTHELPAEITQLVLGDLSYLTLAETEKCFQQIAQFDALVHTAAMAHSDNKESDYLNKIYKVNVEATNVISKVAEKVGVQRFVFISSIGVNGKRNTKAFSETDQPNPHNFYAKCKYDSEQQLLTLANNSAMEVVIVRPPMVYSRNAPGNFAKLTKLVKLGLPLPFKRLNNQRSVIALDNLLSFLTLCADKDHSPAAKNQVFLVSDRQPVSTQVMIEKIANSLGRKTHMAYISPKILLLVFKLIGKRVFYTRLFDSLLISTDKAQNLLGWQPSFNMEQQLSCKNKRFD